TAITYSESGALLTATLEPSGIQNFSNPLPGSYTIPPTTVVRSDDVTVPFADLTVGLTYEVGRVRVGAGYRWERYFDAVDSGIEETKDADRTIDGPFFRIAIGFGG
ncbi:MAG TPA: Lpg1974 family pore-forming outer membrane protein, partial [Caulobacteraceae bacterium]|nr:Lpg1974 family pore-forming outer membrane protein [Caulobacteraceae bacterium]